MNPLAKLCACATMVAVFGLAPTALASNLHQCKSGGDDGKLVFSNVDLDNADKCRKSFPDRKKKAKRKASAGSSSSASSGAKRKNYPSVSQTKQRKRDETRLHILQDEYQSERDAALAYDKQLQLGQLTEEEKAVMVKILNNHILNMQALQQEIQAIK